MNSSNSLWFRLVKAARPAPADMRDTSAPSGFSTRVAALAFASAEASFSAVLARLSWRALTVASLVMAATIAANFKPMLASLDKDVSSASLSDPVGEWLNLS